MSIRFTYVLVMLHVARFFVCENAWNGSERRSTLASSWRRNNLDLSSIVRVCKRTRTRARAEREREREREGGKLKRVRRKAARCEPDEPRTNRATNQWYDGPSLPSLIQRVYHTETNGRKSAGWREGKDTDPPLIPHARSLVLCRVLSRV